MPLTAMGIGTVVGGDVDGDEGEWVVQGARGEVHVVRWLEGKAVRVEAKQVPDLWNEEVGGSRRAVWAQGQQSTHLGGMRRRRVAVVAHAMGGAEVRFSTVPMDGDEHSRPVWQERKAREDDDDLQEEMAVAEQQDVGPAMSDDGAEDEEDRERVQTSLHRFFAPTQAAPLRLLEPAVRERTEVEQRRRAMRSSAWCTCCSHCVSRVKLPAAVTVLESHPTCTYVVCGLANNQIRVVGPASVQDDPEDAE